MKLKKFLSIICTSIFVFNTNVSFAMHSSSNKTRYNIFYQSIIDKIIKHYTITQGYEAFYNAIDLKLNAQEENSSFEDARALVNYLYRQSYSDRKVLYSGMSENEFKKMKFEVNGSDISGDKLYEIMLKKIMSIKNTETSDHNRVICIRPDDNKELTIKYNNFLSTSIDEKVARKFGDIILEIQFENKICGEYIAKKSVHPNEEEVLIPPGAVFKIISIQNLPKLSTDEGEKILVSVTLEAQQNPFNNN